MTVDEWTRAHCSPKTYRAEQGTWAIQYMMDLNCVEPAHNPKKCSNSGQPISITMADDQEETLKDTAVDQVDYPVTEASLVMKLINHFTGKAAEVSNQATMTFVCNI